MALCSITGTLKDSAGASVKSSTVCFVPQSAVRADGAALVANGAHYVQTDATGLLPAALTLYTGKYTVLLPHNESVNVDVPNSVGPVDISSILDTSSSSADTSLYTRRIYTSTARRTINNTTLASLFGATGVGSMTLAASLLSKGRMLRAVCEGYYTSSAAPQILTVAAKLGASNLTSAQITPAASSTGLFRATATVATFTGGTEGTVNTSVSILLSRSDDYSMRGAQGSDDSNYDLTTALALDVNGQWAGSGQTLVVETSYVELLP